MTTKEFPLCFVTDNDFFRVSRTQNHIKPSFYFVTSVPILMVLFWSTVTPELNAWCCVCLSASSRRTSICTPHDTHQPTSPHPIQIERDLLLAVIGGVVEGRSLRGAHGGCPRQRSAVGWPDVVHATVAEAAQGGWLVRGYQVAVHPGQNDGFTL